MKEFKVYLAGGVSNLSKEEQTIWRDTISDMIYNRCKTIDVKYSVDVISPPDYYTFEEQNYDSDLEVMKYYLRHTKSSDLIIVNFNDPKSIGTAQEIAVAYDRNIPIVGLNMTKEILNPWLTCSCDRIFDNYSDLVNYLFKFYLT
jgi:nucleoside 2-deoxyribosyltransferase